MALNKVKINMVSNKPPKSGKPQRPKKDGGKITEIINKIKGKMSNKPPKQVKLQKPKKADGKSPEILSKIKGLMSKKLTWWQILIAILVAVLIIGGIATAIILGTINDDDDNIGDNGDPGVETPPDNGTTEDGGDDVEIIVPSGTVTDTGKFETNDESLYILCEYTEYFSGNAYVVLRKEADVRFNYKPYYVFVSESGILQYKFSGEYTGTTDDDAQLLKTNLLDEVQQRYQYSDENIARCTVHIYQPVKFTKVKVSDILLEDGNATIKYSAGAVGGELSEEYTLTGTYTLTDNVYTFSYTNMPTDEHLLRVADKLLSTAKYRSYVEYEQYVNTVTFGDFLVFKRIEGTAEGEIE